MQAKPCTGFGRPRTILLATVGITPAVLTETVWALSHPARKGAEVVIPDEVFVLSTLRGAREVEKLLLGPDGGWNRIVAAMKKEGLPVDGKLSFGKASIRVLERDKEFLEDIRTGEENEAVADLFLREIRSFTENPRTRLFASIAGGRKTMGALLLSCMSLLGREQDRVLHVLVNEPFDSRLDPPVLFPASRSKHQWRNPETGKVETLRAADLRLDLIDLPFVKMRGWYQDKFKELPPRYSDLVRAAQSSGPKATAQRPLLRFDFSHGAFLADGAPVRLAATEFATLSLDLLRAPENLLASLPLVHAVARKDHRYGWFQDFGDGTRFSVSDAVQTQEDLTKVRNQIRTKLKAVPSLAPFLGELVPRGADHGVWPPARISADIPDFWKRVLP